LIVVDSATKARQQKNVGQKNRRDETEAPSLFFCPTFFSFSAIPFVSHFRRGQRQQTNSKSEVVTICSCNINHGISSFSCRRRKRDAPAVLRGGAYINNARNCRSAYRNHNDARNLNDNCGLRVVVSAASTLD
jgi:hypothetical protein